MGENVIGDAAAAAGAAVADDVVGGGILWETRINLAMEREESRETAAVADASAFVVLLLLLLLLLQWRVIYYMVDQRLPLYTGAQRIHTFIFQTRIKEGRGRRRGGRVGGGFVDGERTFSFP